MPVLHWRLDGVAVQPTVQRELEPLRANGPDGSTVFTGFYEFAGLQPDTTYRVGVAAGGQSCQREMKTLPERVPFAPAGSFSILLASCFSRLSDKSGTRPDLSLFAGDQVYLDSPAFHGIPRNPIAMLEKFEEDYVHN